MSPASRSARALRNTLSNSAGKVVSILTTFVMTPFVLSSLGEAAFGLWVLAIMLVGYGALLDLGIGSAIVKQVATSRGRGEAALGERAIATATRIYAGMAVVALGAGAIVASQVARIADLGPVPVSDASSVILLLTVSFAVNLVGTPSTAALRGMQRYDLTNVLMVINVLVTALLTVLVLRAGGGVVAMVAVTVPVAVGSQVAAAVLVGRLSPGLRLRWSPADRAVAQEMSGFGGTITVNHLAIMLQKRSSEVIVASQLAVAALAPFSLARRLSDLPHVLADQFIKVLLPVSSEMHAVGDTDGLRRLFISATRVTLGLMVPLSLCAGFLAPDLLELWVGPQYREYGHLVALLVATSVAFTAQWPAGAVLQGTGRFGVFAAGSMLAGIATVVITLALVGPWGLTGVALGSLTPTVAQTVLLVMPYSMHKLGVGFSELMGAVLLPAGVPAVPCVLVLVLGGAWIERPHWWSVVLVGAAGVLVYGACYFLMPAARQERGMAGRLVARVIRRG